MKEISIDIEVTMTLHDDGTASVYFYNPMSGDDNCIVVGTEYPASEWDDDAKAVGEEIMGWLPLMQDAFNDTKRKGETA